MKIQTYIKKVMSEAVRTPECSNHLPAPEEVCYACCPQIWHTPEEINTQTTKDLYQYHIENMVHWRYCYYVEGESPVEDSQYDSTEDTIKLLYPEHPILRMVGYDEGMVPECLRYIQENELPNETDYNSRRKKRDENVEQRRA